MFQNNLQLLKMNKLPQKQEEKRKVVSDKHLYDFADPSVELLESVQKYLKAQEPDYSFDSLFAFEQDCQFTVKQVPEAPKVANPPEKKTQNDAAVKPAAQKIELSAAKPADTHPAAE